MKDFIRHPPSSADMETLAADAFGTIPDVLRTRVDGVVLHIEEFPDEDIEREMGLESPFDLLGLYSGVSLDQKSLSDVPMDLDRIYLYRRPILDYWCETGDDLTQIIRHVLIHEIGHHFGLSDDDMEAIEQEG